MIILLDMDGTVYNLQTPWLQWYNHLYNDNLTDEKVVTWDLHDHVVPVCGTHVYDFLKIPGVFFNLAMYPYAQEAIATVHDMGVEQAFMTNDVVAAWASGTRKNGRTPPDRNHRRRIHGPHARDRVGGHR